jgi:hypothetical protein
MLVLRVNDPRFKLTFHRMSFLLWMASCLIARPQYLGTGHGHILVAGIAVHHVPAPRSPAAAYIGKVHCFKPCHIRYIEFIHLILPRS